MTECSGYVVAGFETLAQILANFVNNNKEFLDYVTKEKAINFFNHSTNRFLHSYGMGMSKRVSKSKVVARTLKKCRSFGFFDRSLFYVDSGGFQISVGKLDRTQTEALSESYYDFVQEESDCYDRAFTLDIVPGPGCKVFKSFKDVYDYNMKSYDTAKNLPPEIRDKMIYIHHFRTLGLWRIFSEILNIDGMFDSFKHFATGGIVANMASDILVSRIIYVLPLTPLLIKAKERGITEFDFHILGGSNFRDILFYELIKKHVWEEHKIKLTITYDSSGLFKGLLHGRFLHILENNGVRKLDLRESGLSLAVYKGSSTLNRMQKFLTEMNLMASEFNFKPLTLEGRTLYDPETKTFYRDVNIYAMLYMLWMFARIQEQAKIISERAYVYYLEDNADKFNELIDETTKGFNQGRKSKKQKVKTESVFRSLDMLSKLDLDYCEMIVEKTLGRDEFHYLKKDTKIERDWYK